MKRPNLVGKKFERLTVIANLDVRGRDGRQLWLCQCSCGNTCLVNTSRLNQGRTRSCGCLHTEINRMSKNVHYPGKVKRIWSIWTGMKRRCTDPHIRGWERYGGRGITFCDEWKDFMVFQEWALSHGYADNLTIDRINNDGNYEPSNCRWATDAEQRANKTQRSTKVLCVESNKIFQSINECAAEFEVDRSTIRRCLNDPNRLCKGKHLRVHERRKSD